MANLYFEATLDAEQLKKELRDVNHRLDGFTKQAKQQGAEMDATFKRIGAAMAGYFSITAAKGFVDQMIQVRGEFQQLEIAMESIIGNKARADQLMSDVIEMAAKTPFSLAEVGQGAKQLLAVQEPVDEVMNSLRQLGDISAGLSVPLSQLIKAYGDVRAKGRLMGQEMLQFMNAGVPIVAELAKHMDVAESEVSDLVAKGKVGFNDLKAVISNLSDEGGMFYNLMEKQSASLTGRVSNLGDSWEQMLNKVGESNEGILYAGIDGLNSLVENYETVLDVLKAIVVTYGAYKGAVVLLHMAEKARNISGAISAWFSLAKGIKTAKDAQLAFNLATKMNPLGLAAAGVAALVAGIVLFTGKTEQAAGVSAEFSRDLEGQTKALDANFKALKSTTSGTDARKLAIDQINSKYGPYLDNLLTEKSTLEDIEKAQKRATQELARSIAFKAQQADLETFREDIAKSENAFSQALKQLFALNDVPAEIGGQVAAELDKMMRDWSETDIKNRVGFGDAFAQVFKDAGVEIDLLGVKGNNAYKGLFQSMQTVIDARQDERKATEELSSAYDAYLKQLGLSDDSSKKKGTDTEDGEVEGFKLEDFKKHLDERKKAYDDYNDAVRNARDEDKAALATYYKDLTAQGEDYEEYLKNQLEAFRGNVEAKTAIYQAAAKANVDLVDDRAKPIKGRPRLSPATSKAQSIAPSNQDMTKLREAQQRYNVIYERIRNVTESQQEMDLAGNLIDAAYAGQDLASAVGQFDEELGASLSKMSDVAGSIGNVVGAFGSGDPVAMVSGVISLVSSIGSFFGKSETAQERAAKAAERMRHVLELQNRALERQIYLMNQASGEDRVKAERETLELIKKQQEETLRTLQNTNLSVGVLQSLVVDRLGVELEVDLSEGNEIEELESKLQELEPLAKLGIEVKGKEQLMELLDLYYELEETQQRITEQIVGTTSTDIADSIVQGFKEGKSAIEDFAKTFEELMIDAILNTFKTQAVMAAIEPFYAELASRMEDGELDDSDISYLQGLWETINKGLSTQFEGLKDVITEGLGYDPFADTADTSLSGAIKGVSEETASILAGQMNAIRINQAESLRLMNESARYWAEIAANTSYNRYLEGIHADIKAMRSAGSDLKAKGF